MVGTAQKRLCQPYIGYLPTRLPQLPPRRHRQRADDLLATHHHHLVHHVDDDANVIWHDADDVADIGPGVAAGEIEEAVFLGEARDLRLWMLQDQPVAV